MSVIAIDCEMVKSGKRNLLARVSIVDPQGSVLLDEYVKPTATIDDYMTLVSGIKIHHLDNGKSFKQVQNAVFNLIKDKVLVGHSLENDLNAVLIIHPECNLRDISKYEPFMKNGQPQSLKDLAKIYLNKIIHDGEHDSVEDARTAMELYNVVANGWN